MSKASSNNDIKNILRTAAGKKIILHNTAQNLYLHNNDTLQQHGGTSKHPPIKKKLIKQEVDDDLSDNLDSSSSENISDTHINDPHVDDKNIDDKNIDDKNIDDKHSVKSSESIDDAENVDDIHDEIENEEDVDIIDEEPDNTVEKDDVEDIDEDTQDVKVTKKNIKKPKLKDDDDNEPENNSDEENNDDCLYQYDDMVDTKLLYEPPKEITDKERKTDPIMTRYEENGILGSRAKQISLGAKILLTNISNNMSSTELATYEIIHKSTPMKIKRPLPNNTYEIWKVSELSSINDDDSEKIINGINQLFLSKKNLLTQPI